MNVTVLDPEQAQFKAADQVTTDLRTLEFYGAAFSKTPDLNGDIIEEHAFDDWLQEFYAAGKPLPISFSHAAVMDGLDPTNVIGYAPADPQHVWVDDYGLRIRGFIDTTSEKGKAVEWQIENKLIGGASIAYVVPPGGLKEEKGHTRVMKAAVREAGPTPNPANQEAVLLWMKQEHLLDAPSDLPYMTVAEFRATFETKAVDTGAWDGNRAMGECSSASDYRQICAAEHTVGDPDERQHWALPHHFLGKGPNAAGTQNALGRLPQTQNISDSERSSARSHLESHMRQINPDYQPPKSESLEFDTKHAASPRYIQAAHDALVRGGAKCAPADEITASAPPEPDPVAARLRRLRFVKTSLT